MGPMRWSCSRWPGALAAAATLALASPRAVAAQDGLRAACESEECAVADAAVRLIHPRVGLGLWGGSPVPGSASTLGMRIGSMPRISIAARGVLVPMELPPLADRPDGRTGERGYAAGLSVQATVGVLAGWSPMPTVGGVGSLDVITRLSWLGLPEDRGFDGGVFGWSAGVRVGVLRESFTLPGVSLVATYGRSGELRFGDPDQDAGFIEGSIAGWSGTVAATKRIGPVGLTAGARFDRTTGDVEFSYAGAEGRRSADASTDRWSGFANVSWTLLVFHAVAELGWQEAPTPGGLPADVSLDPAGWWAGLAFRISI